MLELAESSDAICTTSGGIGMSDPINDHEAGSASAETQCASQVAVAAAGGRLGWGNLIAADEFEFAARQH